ncbi:hypothetical protein BDV37DRAFT_10055 [Aspergillus pseudonomiae]|uniref:Uncharacterized protein n=1 Tax=Aspergillus pseudonomiae TaxID=1506151 RepID=A0A5N7CYH2_9EURO|nr:uncharacterized protein BDV37DRAFT_10055 [Aspergillus pseudonomiae]KAE8399246.1 hypothetical protein BDV37DRAFT_10055 [Aspergillus pseudonomiae]
MDGVRMGFGGGISHATIKSNVNANPEACLSGLFHPQVVPSIPPISSCSRSYCFLIFPLRFLLLRHGLVHILPVASLVIIIFFFSS